MKRNLDRRMETIVPVNNSGIKAELEEILSVYEKDNTFSWDMMPNGRYLRRKPAEGDEPLAAQSHFASFTR